MSSIFNDEVKLRKAVSCSLNYSDVLNYMGCKTHGNNYKYLYKYIIKFEIDDYHLKNGFKGKRLGRNGIDIQLIITNQIPFKSTHDLKNRLYKEGLKQRKCELCGQGEEWQGKKMSLILDHIDGNNKNNLLTNLQIVCPNCDATLDTFKGRNNKNKKTLQVKSKNIRIFSENEKNQISLRKKKKIIQCDLNMNPIKEWDSIKEASIALNINMQSISANCLGKNKTASGFKWIFK